MLTSWEFHDEREPPEYLWVLWSRKWSILAIATFVVGAAFVQFAELTDVYRSSADVVVRPLSRRVGAVEVSEFRNLEPERRVATSREVFKLVVKRLGGVEPAARISVEAPESTNTLSFSATSHSPVIAQRTAQAYAEAYLAFRLQEIVDDLHAAARPLKDQIEELGRQVGEAYSSLSAASGEPARTALQLQLTSLLAQLQVREEKRSDLLLPEQLRVGRVLHPAYLPTTPIGPGLSKVVLMALMLGMALGVGQAFVRSRFQPRLQSQRDLTKGIGAPVLGLIPAHSGGCNGLEPFSANSSKGAKAYRGLRTAVLSVAEQQGVRSLLITSPDKREGKTTIAANLGASLVKAGKRVILVCAGDGPQGLDRHFPGGESSPGVSSVLSGDTPVSDALTVTFATDLRILHRGPIGIAQQPLASSAMRRVLQELQRHADLVIVDGPPVLKAEEAAVIASMVDAVLVVATADRTTTSSLQETRTRLEEVGAYVIGAVLNNVAHARILFEQRYESPNETYAPAQHPVASNAR